MCFGSASPNVGQMSAVPPALANPDTSSSSLGSGRARWSSGLGLLLLLPPNVGPLPHVTPAQVTPARVWNPAPSSVSTKPLSPTGALECMEWGRAGVGQGLHGPRTQSFPFPLEAPGLPPCPRKGLLSPTPARSPSLPHAEPALTVAPDPSPVPLPAQGRRSTGLSRSHQRTPPSRNLHKQKRSSGELPADCGVQGRLWSLGPSHLSSARWRGSFCKHRGHIPQPEGRDPKTRHWARCHWDHLLLRMYRGGQLGSAGSFLEAATAPGPQTGDC